MLEYCVKQGGIVCCASYSKDFKVKHVVIEGEKQLQKEIENIRGSKYVQSDLSDVFKQIKKFLKSDRLICFIGTTCQVTGLATYLGCEFENLIMVDVVCHGTPSPKLFEKYLDYQKNKYNSDIKKIVFRNKTYGYHSGTMMIEFDNGKVYYGSARVDYMLKSFFKEVSSRPSCYDCKFKTKKRVSDFTIYDAWHASELADFTDDDKGYTHVIIHSEKGLKVLDKIKDEYIIHEVDSDLAVKYDGIMVTKSAIPNPKRDDYYKNLSENKLEDHINSFIPITKKDYILEKSKSFFYKINLISVMQRIKRLFKHFNKK